MVVALRIAKRGKPSYRPINIVDGRSELAARFDARISTGALPRTRTRWWRVRSCWKTSGYGIVTWMEVDLALSAPEIFTAVAA